jgi:hypothetical protein
MKVKRIVANVEAQNPGAAKHFYQDVLGLELLMDLGWIATFGSGQKMSVQISFMSEGGSDTPTPDLSIEVDVFVQFPFVSDMMTGPTTMPGLLILFVRLTPAFVAKATVEPGASRTTYWDTAPEGWAYPTGRAQGIEGHPGRRRQGRRAHVGLGSHRAKVIGERTAPYQHAVAAL